MRQKYYCPNCGAPVVLGEKFCIGCGINFTWIAQPDPPPQEPISYRLPPREGPAQSAGPQQKPDQALTEAGQGEPPPDPTHESKGFSSFGGTATPLSNEIAKLLEGFFERRCSKA